MSAAIGWIVLCLAAALGGTIWVGRSRENKEGNASYEKRTGGNWARLTLVYVLAAVLGIWFVLYIVL